MRAWETLLQTTVAMLAAGGPAAVLLVVAELRACTAPSLAMTKSRHGKDGRAVVPAESWPAAFSWGISITRCIARLAAQTRMWSAGLCGGASRVGRLSGLTLGSALPVALLLLLQRC